MALGMLEALALPRGCPTGGTSPWRGVSRIGGCRPPLLVQGGRPMTFVHALSILSVALGQAMPAPGSGDATSKIGPQLPEPRLVPVPAKTPPPALVPDGAPDLELSAEGEQHGELDRSAACVLPGWREDDLVPQGYKLVPALAESPPGWRRDERQRVMQVNFDLARRLWLGAGYGAGTFPWSKQGEGTAGVRWDVPFHLAGAPALARIRALETFVAFDGEFADFTVFGVDASRAYPSPLLRLTTFVGKPRRFDPPLFIGAWLEVVRIESLRTESHRWFDRISAGSAALTLDLWRSRDLASFVRLRGGAGYETVDQLTGGAWTPQAAADLDLTLDEGGFHHLRGTFLAEWIKPAGTDDFQPEDPAVARLPSDRHRWTTKAEYEWIFLAVNDQPLSVVLDARAQSRNDVPELPTKWFFQDRKSVV